MYALRPRASTADLVSVDAVERCLEGLIWFLCCFFVCMVRVRGELSEL